MTRDIQEKQLCLAILVTIVYGIQVSNASDFQIIFLQKLKDGKESVEVNRRWQNDSAKDNDSEIWSPNFRVLSKVLQTSRG